MPWIFQGNPKNFGMREYLRQSYVYWLVNRYTDEFQRGDQVLCWESGADGGVVAYGVVIETPVARHAVNRPEDLGDALWSRAIPDPDKTVVGLRVLASATSGLFVARGVLKQRSATAGLDILRMPQATVFRCSAEQLASVLDGKGSV